MAELWNKKEQRIEDGIGDLEVQEKVFSGAYDFLGGPDAKIALDLGRGGPSYIPASQAAKYIANGATYLTPVEVQRMRENKEFAESPLGAVSALATGVDEYMFAGGGSHVLEAMNLIPEGRTESIQHASPWINHGAGIGASVLAVLGSLGTSAAVQTGAKGAVLGASTLGKGATLGKSVANSAATKGAVAMSQSAASKASLGNSAKSIASKGYDVTKSALADYTLPGIGTKLALAADDKIGKYLMKNGDKYVPKSLANSEVAKRYGPQVAKMTSATIASGIEGGVWGLGQGISEAIVGAPEESAENILDSIGTNVLLGMAFGGAVSGVTPFLAGAKGAAANVANRFIDFSADKSDKVSKKFIPYLTTVAEKSGLPPKTVEWLKKAANGDFDIIKELDDFQSNMGVSAAKIAKVLDLLRIQKQFVEISDIQGFRLDVLEDAVAATREGNSININIGSILNDDTSLSNLSKQYKAKQDEFLKAQGDDVRQGKILEEIDEIKAKRKSRENEIRKKSRQSDVGTDEYSLPSNMLEVFENVGNTYSRVRLTIANILKQTPGADADGFITNTIKSINDQEISLYKDFLSDENILKFESKIRQKAAASKTKPLSSKEKDLIKENENKFTKLREKFLSEEGFKPFVEFSKSFPKPKDVARMLRKELDDAFSDALHLGNFNPLIEFIETRVKAEGTSALLLDDFFFMDKDLNYLKSKKDLIKKLYSRESTIDTAGIKADEFVKQAKKLRTDLNLHAGDSKKLSIIESEKGVPKPTQYALEGPMRNTSGFPKLAKTKNPDGSDGDPIPVFRSIDRLLKTIGYEVFDDSLVARSFKSIEDIQTYLLKSLEYGSVSQGVAVDDAIRNQVINILRSDMKNRNKWGQMAKLKEQFDNQAEEFSELNKDIEEFTSKVGTKIHSDPAKFLAFVSKLNDETSEIKLRRLTEYGRNGRDLLDIIRTNFDQTGIEKPGVSSGISSKLPESVYYGIKKKLREIDEIGSDLDATVGRVSDESLDWDSRLKSMMDYSQSASNELDSVVDSIAEKLPIAQALISTNARGENITNSISDLGRGGIISAIMYATTGSAIASAAAGAAVGASSMALQPEKYIQLMVQMKTLHDANKELIEKYMKNWAENTVPKAAITQEWEKKSRSMLMVSSQPYQRDKREDRTSIRRKMAQSRNVDSWSEKIEEALNSELTEENFFESSVAINQLASSKFLMEKFTREATKVFEATPDIRNAMKIVLERKIKIASRLIPKTNTGTAFSDPVPPSSFQLQEFGRQLQVLNSPKDTILTAMLSGTLTPEMVTVFAEAWPKIYEQVTVAAMQAINDPEVRKNLSQSQKIVLATLTGSQMMDASEAARLSETFAPKEGGGGGGQPGPRPGGMRQSVNALSAGTTDGTLNR